MNEPPSMQNIAEKIEARAAAWGKEGLKHSAKEPAHATTCYCIEKMLWELANDFRTEEQTALRAVLHESR